MSALTEATETLAPISKVGGGIKRVPGQYLIWSNYHGAWHCRSSTGRAAGYAGDLERAGLFDWEVARHYNDGKRGRDRLIHPRELRLHIAARRTELMDVADNLSRLEEGLSK